MGLAKKCLPAGPKEEASPRQGPCFDKGLFKNNLNILHLIFGPSLAAAQSQNPQRSAATPAVSR